MIIKRETRHRKLTMNLRKIKYLYFTFYLIFVHLLFAQSNVSDLSFEYLTISDGLSQNTVLSIVQDSTGYLWFGTRDGLNRYDGYTLKKYYSDFANPNSLSSNEITVLDVAPDGVIWIGTNNGLNSFDPLTENFTQYFHSDSDTVSVSNNSIRTIAHNSNGDVFVGTDDGLSIFSKGKFQNYKIGCRNNTKKSRIVISLAVDVNENLWVGGRQFLMKYDSKTKKIEEVKIFSKKNRKLQVQSMVFANDTELWIGTITGIMKYDIVTHEKNLNLQQEIKFNPFVRQYLRELYKDTNGNIWFAEWNGLRIFEKDTKKIVFYKKSVIEGSLNNNAINTIFEDKSGGIWLGTSFGGVNYCAPAKKKFNVINHKLGLSNDIVSAIAEDKFGNLWLGTIGGGLNKVDKKTGKVEVINRENAGLINNLIRVIKIDGSDIWIGDWGNNLTKYSPSTRKVKLINLATLGFVLHPSNTIKDIEIDDKHNLWVATSRNGIFKFTSKNRVENFSTDSSNYLGNNLVKEIFFDHKNVMWAITDIGLSKYDEESNSFKRLKFTTGNTRIENNKMFSVYVDDENIFWLGTNGNGLFKIDIINENCQQYTVGKNIPNNVVYGILPDSDGYLWLSTNKGLAKFNPKTATSVNFTAKDGLQSNEFNDNAFLKTSDGKLIFGGIAGVNIINPASINTNKYIPPIVITNVKFLNQTDNDMNYLKKITSDRFEINYDQADFTVQFSALNFLQSQNNRYAYKLEPINKNWIYLEHQRSLTFTNLSHGKYTLKIKGSNNDGLWNEEGTKLSIVVLPPFWLKWWFILIVVLFFSGIIFLAIYLKIRSLIKVERLRTKIASDLHDDVGASLTKIAMNASLLNYETERERIKKRVKTLNTLSQEVISVMSDIVWSIDARNDTVQDMIDRMKNFVFNHVAESEMDVNFNSECLINNEKLKINIRQNIYLIFKEAFHNAVKYSNSKQIDVSLSATKKGIKLKIVDNGVGLQRKNNNLGNGLRNMQLRADRINGELQLVNENGLTIILMVKKI